MVPEFHRVSGYESSYPVADFTASGELRPALKTLVFSCHVHIICDMSMDCNPHILGGGNVRVLKKFKIPLYAKEEKYIKMNLS